ncbi:GroES-like protein [Trametes elegans]|nr:GroES-like protein [Trametes elegans]
MLMSTTLRVDDPSPPVPGTMTAYRLVPGKTGPQRETIPVPVPGPAEVLIKVLAAGLCHSDLHVLDAALTRPHHPHPYTLGHEGAGSVVRLGDGVAADPALARRFAIGTYVAILTTNACARPECDACGRGLANACLARPLIGLGADGSWEQYVVADANTVVPVPGNDPWHPRLPPRVVAVATDAVLTPWHALTRAADVRPGQTVLVFGCGGLGSNAIQIAKHALGAGTLIASDVRPENLELARRLGADNAVLPDELKPLLHEQGITIDAVLDVVGKQATIDAGMDLLRSGGTLTLIGLEDETVSFRPLVATRILLSIRASFAGTCASLSECLDAIAEEKVIPEVEEHSLDECVAMVQALAKGEVRARVALIPQ